AATGTPAATRTTPVARRTRDVATGLEPTTLRTFIDGSRTRTAARILRSRAILGLGRAVQGTGRPLRRALAVVLGRHCSCFLRSCGRRCGSGRDRRYPGSRDRGFAILLGLDVRF